MTETLTDYAVESITFELTELEQLNIDVAEIAGWENIEEWNPNPKARKPKRSFTGTNKGHPELGVHIPDYVNDLNAIVSVFDAFDLDWNIGKDCNAYNCHGQGDGIGIIEEYAETPAIALCKLLLELDPKPETKPEVIEATFG